MKKLFAIAAMAAMLIACGEDPSNTDDPGKDPNGGGNTDLPANLDESLKGTNYYPIVMDAVTYEYIKNNVVADLRVDGGGTPEEVAESVRKDFVRK